MVTVEPASDKVNKAPGVLLTVSGTLDPERRALADAGRHPRADYFELADTFGAEIVDFGHAVEILGCAGRALDRMRLPDVALALACFRRRRRHRVIFTDSERVGMLYALLSRLDLRRDRPRHVMIGHRLSPPKKVLAHRVLGLRRRIDDLVVYASPQREVAIGRLGYRPEHVVLTPFMVDTVFWNRDRIGVAPAPRARPMICAVGLEFRDYPTLVDAVRGLDVDVVIAAASPWSKRSDSSSGVDLPPNVTVVKLDQFRLRQLYADASFVVVPLVETDFQAGITTILEAMSMERAVVCSRATGQTDTVVDGETGLYVPPGDPDALRTAIQRLVASAGEARRLGEAGQRWARQHADIEVYVRNLSAVVKPWEARADRSTVIPGRG